ncbi:MAG: hypothetical protein WB689_40055, partial [Xanthobacteraceae bacterium]
DCSSAFSALSMISNSTLLNSCFSTVALLTLTQRHACFNWNGRAVSGWGLRIDRRHWRGQLPGASQIADLPPLKMSKHPGR